MPKVVSKTTSQVLSLCLSFDTVDSMATSAEQQHKVLKAKVAMALYSEYGKVPKEKEIDEVYHLTRVLYKAVLGTHFLRKKLERTGQLALF